MIVHGDTVSSVLGALVAKMYGVKLAHVESGLRSFNLLEPFPEEICRNIVSRLSDLSFCPNPWAVSNLKHKKGKAINTKQNTLYETFQMALKLKKQPQILKKLKNKYFILVVHRQEHVIFGKNETKGLVERVLNHVDKNLTCVLIMHALTQNFLNKTDPALYTRLKKNSVLTPRLPFPEFMTLLKGSEFIVTDGGSNQEESYYMGKPCLLLRSVTERREGLGKNVVLSKGEDRIIADFLLNYKKYITPVLKDKTHPAKIIIDRILNDK
jgi:UDP-N-acetylglucosamine 2-epimerase (non-hydrolysing)